MMRTRRGPKAIRLERRSPSASHLLGWWPLAADGRQCALDGLPHGTLIGGTTVADADRRQVIDLNGSSDYLQTGSPVYDPPTPNRLTLSLWIKPANLTTYQTLCGKRNTATTSGYELAFRGDVTGDRLQFTLFGIVSVTSDPSGFAAGIWYFVVLTYDQQYVRFYVDGRLLSAHAQTGAIRSAATLNLFWGCQNSYGSPSLYFAGRVQDARIFARVLSSTDVLQIYLSTRRLPFGDLAMAPRRWSGRIHRILGSDGMTPDALRVYASLQPVNHLAAIRTIHGVVIRHAAAKNGPGVGLLRSCRDGTWLSWQAPGSNTMGDPIGCPTDGIYLLRDGEDAGKWLRVQVYTAHLLATPHEARVVLGDRYANGPPHDDVTAGEAAAGDITSYSLELINESSNPITSLVAWIDSGVSGLAISDDDASWVSPTTEAGGLALADLAPGQSEILYVRRTIGAGAEADPSILTLLHLAYDSI